MDVGDLTRGAPPEDVPSAARWRRGSWDGAAGGGVRSSLVISMLHLPFIGKNNFANGV